MSAYLSLAEVAQRLGVNPMTVRREVARGNLPAIRVGRQLRIREVDLEQAYRPIPSAAVGRG